MIPRWEGGDEELWCAMGCKRWRRQDHCSTGGDWPRRSSAQPAAAQRDHRRRRGTRGIGGDDRHHRFAAARAAGDGDSGRPAVSGPSWITARCQPVFAAAAAFIVSLTVVWTITFGIGPFGDPALR